MTKLLYELQILLDLIVVQCKQILPYWLGGTLFASVISVFASAKLTQLASGIANKKYNLFQLIIATALGVASPVCMYGTVPLLSVLGKKNVPQYILAAFMVSSVLLNPNLLIMSFALGAPLALLRLFFSVTGGILGGTLVYLFFRETAFFSLDHFESDDSQDKTKVKKHFFKDVLKSIRITLPYLMFGMVLTALFDRYFPPSLMDTLFLRNKALSVLFMASAGVPVYVCGGGTIPLLSAWLDAGMSQGSAVAFMLSGPATKLTNLSAIKIILGTRHFIFYIGYSLLFAVLAGLLTDFVYPFIG